MLTIIPQYITDKKGNKISVVIPVNEFETIMEELDELDDIKLYDEAKSDNEPSEVFEMVEIKRKTKSRCLIRLQQ